MKLDTQAIHEGYKSEETTKAVAIPIYQTVAYSFDDTQHGADLFNLAVPGNIYTRIMNPTNAVLEERLAAMEGGIGALAVASGMAAITYAIQSISEVGSNIVSTSQLYGGTYNLFRHTLPKQGIEARLVSHDDAGQPGTQVHHPLDATEHDPAAGQPHVEAAPGIPANPAIIQDTVKIMGSQGIGVEKQKDISARGLRAVIHLCAPVGTALQDTVHAGCRNPAGVINAAAVHQDHFMAPGAGRLEPLQGRADIIRLVQGGDDNRVFLHGRD